MKKLNDIIASSLVELVNKSFQSGILPDISKTDKLTPIFKVSHEYSVITIDQHLSSQTLAN